MRSKMDDLEAVNNKSLLENDFQTKITVKQ